MSVDPNIRQQVMEILSDPMNLPSEFWNYDVQNWVKEAPVFPISQVFGFTQFTGQTATTIATAETTSSATYTDLATTGPTLSSIADGKYIIVFGCDTYFNTGAGDVQQQQFMSVSLNAAAASDTNACTGVPVSNAVPQSMMRAITTSLSNNGSNSVTAKYRVSGGASPSHFQNRWLFALKYGNL